MFAFLAERRKLYQNRRAAVKSTRGQLTTEVTETPLAAQNWLAKRRLKRKSAHFNTIYKRNEGWLRKAEGLVSPTTFRVRINEVSLEVLHVPRYDSILNHHGFLTRQLNGTSV